MKEKLTIGKSRQLALLSAAVLTIIAWAPRNVQSVEAKGATGEALIDPEWENSLRTHFEKRLFSYIEASDDQEKTLDALFKERLDETRSTREKLREGAVELAKLFASSNAKDDQIEMKAKELRTLHDQLADSRLASALKIRNILNADQRKLISDHIISRLGVNERHHLLQGM